MDNIHTPGQNCIKIQGLIELVWKLNAQKDHLPPDFIKAELESLSTLADEAAESLEAIKVEAIRNNNR